MSGDTETVVENPSFLAMSDDELMQMSAPPQAGTAPTPDVSTEVGDSANVGTRELTGEPVAADKTGAKPGAEAAAAATLDAGDAAEDQNADTTTLEGQGTGEEVKPAAESADKADPVVEPVQDKPEKAAALDFEAEYKRLLTPFKANGRDIQVGSVDDAIALMQMGANYNKKMAALKPNLKLMKMLETNGFLSEDKIGFLIDLGRKDPAAINKLVKDSGIDPMDLDAEKAQAYKQSTYAVDDREMELDTVLDELQGTPSYTRTLDVVSNQWDGASKQTISQSPQLLRVINDHVASGIYDLISTELERERVFGRLTGLSDIDAYRQIGDAIHARGGFNHLGKPQTEKTPPVEIVQPKPKPTDDDKLKDKRRAASSTKTVVSSTAAKEFNPLSMSDEEFNKLINQQLL